MQILRRDMPCRIKKIKNMQPPKTGLVGLYLYYSASYCRFTDFRILQPDFIWPFLLNISAGFCRITVEDVLYLNYPTLWKMFFKGLRFYTIWKAIFEGRITVEVILYFIYPTLWKMFSKSSRLK